MARSSLVLGFLGLCLSLPPADSSAEPKKRGVVRADKGFIDDGLALSADGETIFYVATDGATFAELRAAKLDVQGASKDIAAIPLPRINGSRILPLSDPSEVLLVEKDPEGDKETGVLYSLTKKTAKGRIGPAESISLGLVGTTKAVLAFTKGSGEYKIGAFAQAGLRPLSQKAYKLKPEGTLALGPSSVTPLYFAEGGVLLAGKKAGEYDKKNDIRKPDQLALYDLLSGTQRSTTPIADPVPLAELAQLRSRHVGESVFVSLEPGGGRLELVGADTGASGKDPALFARRVPLSPKRQIALYEPSTLRYQLLSPKRLLFSLTVDPTNEVAVKRKKRDKDLIDFCVVSLDAEPPTTSCPLELDGLERPSGWTASGGKLLVLRKHRGFSRGGTEAEVYDLDLGEGGK